MKSTHWFAGLAGIAIITLTGCATDETPGAASPSPTTVVSWPDPPEFMDNPDPGLAILLASYPVLDEYTLEAYDYRLAAEPSSSGGGYSEMTVWMADGEGERLIDDFDTEPLETPVELLPDWDHAAPSDLESSESLTEWIFQDYEGTFTAAVSPGTDMLFLLVETPGSS